MKLTWRLRFGVVWTAMLSFSAFASSPGIVFTSLYSFTGGVDGSLPRGPLMQSSDGMFYGTTCGTNFGRPPGTHYSGTVFKYTPSGGVTTLYTFNGGDDGADPYGGLVQGANGFLYGTTSWDGTNGAGTVYKITTNGDLTTLCSFTGGVFGGPQCTLLPSSDGFFYGTTFWSLGGSLGSVFKIDADGDFTNLYAFSSPTPVLTNGGYPAAGLMQTPDEILYGVTTYGGTNYGGTVFKMTTNGALNTLYSFSGPSDGMAPYARLAQGSDGYLYGTTSTGGTNNFGTIFKITTNGDLTTLHSFNGGSDGRYCRTGLTLGSDGYFYGTTGTNYPHVGTLFRITTNGAFTTLYTFTGGIDGTFPGQLVQARDGNFYGAAVAGGTNDLGVIFRLTILPDIQTVALTNGALSLTWSVETGGTYQLQYSSDLSTGVWTDLGPATVATNSSFIDSDSITNGPQRFYRLALSP